MLLCFRAVGRQGRGGADPQFVYAGRWTTWFQILWTQIHRINLLEPVLLQFAGDGRCLRVIGIAEIVAKLRTLWRDVNPLYSLDRKSCVSKEVR